MRATACEDVGGQACALGIATALEKLDDKRFDLAQRLAADVGEEQRLVIVFAWHLCHLDERGRGEAAFVLWLGSRVSGGRRCLGDAHELIAARAFLTPSTR